MVEVVGPALERGTHLWLVLRPIINTSNRGFMSRLVIKDRFYVMRLHAQLCHVGRCTPSAIVQSPRRNAQSRIKPRLRSRPTQMLAEYEFCPLRLALQDC